MTPFAMPTAPTAPTASPRSPLAGSREALNTSEQIAVDRAAAAVASYLHRLGFLPGSAIVEDASIEVATDAARSLPKLKRSDASLVVAAAMRQTIRNLDHWLRLLAEQTSVRSLPGRVAASLETGQRTVAPSTHSQPMAAQRFRNRPAIWCRYAVRRVATAVARCRPVMAARTAWLGR